MSTNRDGIIELSGVSKHYQQGKLQVTALDGVSMSVAPGEFLALCGPSGSGKTTMLNLIGALDVPSEGAIRLEGQALEQLSRKQLSELRRDRIGFVFQAYNLMPVMTAYENAEMVLWVQGMDAQERQEKVMALLKEVGLEGMEDRRPNELSGGQQQRVAIARAIASDPVVVLADEPTANVDSETAIKLLDLMERLNRERGVTFVFSTHDPLVMERAQRIVRLVDGKIVEDTGQGEHNAASSEAPAAQ